MRQTYKNFNVIVSDNHSTDNTPDIVREYIKKYDNIKLVLADSPADKYFPGEDNFNKCITLGHGDYMALFHADDVYNEKMIEEEVKFLDENSECSAVCTLYNLIDKDNNLLETKDIFFAIFYGQPRSCTFEEIFSHILQHGYFFVLSTLMVRTDIYKNKIIRYNYEKFGSSSDIDVLFRLAEKHKIGIIPKRLINYRRHSASGSSMLGFSLKRFKVCDFFNVIDYYVKNKKIAVNKYGDAYLVYLFSRKIDKINLAINMFLNNDKKTAIDLTRGIFKPHYLKIALSSRYKAVGYIRCLLTYLLIRSPFVELSKKILYWIHKKRLIRHSFEKDVLF